MAGRLDGKVALVTGGGSGIGRAITLALTAEGASVAISGRTATKLDGVIAEITARGGQGMAIVGDVGVAQDFAAMIEAVIASHSRLDILVNNAQTLGKQLSIEDTTDAEVEMAFRSGAMGTFYGMKLALPYLKVRGGSIVNLGSPTAVLGDPTFGYYAMAKEAIRGLSRVAAKEWGQYNIRVNTVCPTAMTESSQDYVAKNPERYASLLSATPLGRYGDPEGDIGRAVAALVSDDMSYLSGATLMLNGGRTPQ